MAAIGTPSDIDQIVNHEVQNYGENCRFRSPGATNLAESPATSGISSHPA
jgi:hypothetical protein